MMSLPTKCSSAGQKRQRGAILIGKTAGSDVIVQRVEPDIHHVTPERLGHRMPQLNVVRLIDR